VDSANYENEIDLELALQKAEGGERIDHTIVVPKQPPRLFRRGSSDISETTYEDDEVIDLVTMLCQTKAANIMVEAINSNPRGDGKPVISNTASSTCMRVLLWTEYPYLVYGRIQCHMQN